MTYFPKIQVSPSDGPNLDAFNRQRTSAPVTLFDSKQVVNNQSLFWSERNTGTGNSLTYSGFRASTTLTVSSSVGNEVTRQTRRRFNYQPGKSLLVDTTFVMGAPVLGFHKEIGYFDDENGLFLQQHASASINFVKRSSVSGVPIDTVVSQSAWNLDPLDGTGTSGHTIDFTKGQIMTIDMQWLGVGRVRLGFVLEGQLVYAHEFLHVNEIDSVYMSTPNLPVRTAVTCVSESVSMSASLEQICASVISEGGYDPSGVSFGVNRGGVTQDNVDNGAIYPLLSLRLNSGSLDTNIVPKGINVYTSANADYKWVLVLNPTINGTDSGSWQQVTSSSMEYDISRTVANTLSGGILLKTGYATKSTDVIASDIDTSFAFGATVDGIPDELVLGVTRLDSATGISFLAAMNWQELS